MDQTNPQEEKTFGQKVGGFFQAVGNVIKKIENFFGLIISFFVRMRKPIMAVPVIYGAVKLAQYNNDHLPDMVGIDLQATGEYAYMITKQTAILAPLAVTAFCLLLMFLSKRTVYPWIISIFSLVLPLLVLVINIFPG